MTSNHKLVRWIFSGKAKVPLSDLELGQFTAKQRKIKLGLGITGRFMYADRKFISILEGVEQPLTKFGHAIEGDERHSGVTNIQFKAVQRREFSDWCACYPLTEIVNPQEGVIPLQLDSPPLYLGFPQESESYIYFYGFWRSIARE